MLTFMRALRKALHSLAVPIFVWCILVIPVLVCIWSIASVIGYSGVCLPLFGCIWGFFVTLVMHKVGVL